MGQRLDHDDLALDGSEAAGEKEIILGGPSGEFFRAGRGMIERLRFHPAEARHAAGYVLRNGVNALRFRQQPAIRFSDGVAHLRAVWGQYHVARDGVIPQVVRLAMLVQNPQNLVGMGDQVSRELQPDQEVHFGAGAFGEIQQAAGQHVIEDLFGRIPLEGNFHHLGLMPGGFQSGPQPFRQHLRPAPDEWDLDGRDENPHRLYAFRPMTA